MESSCSDIIRQVICRQGVKQKAIAEKAGITEKAFSHMLNGRKLITDAHILPICNALGITPNELFGFYNAGEKGV